MDLFLHFVDIKKKSIKNTQTDMYSWCATKNNSTVAMLVAERELVRVPRSAGAGLQAKGGAHPHPGAPAQEEVPSAGQRGGERRGGRRGGAAAHLR